MPALRSYEVSVRGSANRVWESGDGEPVVFFAGIGGLPAWPAFLDELSSQHRVIAPSLPGFPGAEAFRHLDSYLDWLVAALELIEGLDCARFDLIGSSVGGALAAEITALVPDRIRRLVLIAPFGVYQEDHPGADIWAQPPGPDAIPNLVCSNPENWKALWEMPADADPVEWGILSTRAMEAAARFLFPMGDTRIANRLNRIQQPTLLARGADDRVIPAENLQVFADAIVGPVTTTRIDGAGHLAELDQPERLAREINAFLRDQQPA